MRKLEGIKTIHLHNKDLLFKDMVIIDTYSTFHTFYLPGKFVADTISWYLKFIKANKI